MTYPGNLTPFDDFDDEKARAAAKQLAKQYCPPAYLASVEATIDGLPAASLTPQSIGWLIAGHIGANIGTEREAAANAALASVGRERVLTADLPDQFKRLAERTGLSEDAIAQVVPRLYPRLSPSEAKREWLRAIKGDAAPKAGES